MSTYLDLKNRIADDLLRTDLTAQIGQNILLVIKAYAHERLWFNETSTTLATAVGVAQVTAPTGLLAVDEFFITISGRNIPLVPTDLNDCISFRPTSNARPLAYSFYQNRFELDVLADAVYSLPLYYLKELTALSGDTDTNGWTTDAEDLVVFATEKRIYANIIKDSDKATIAGAQERESLLQLRRDRVGRVMLGYTRAVYL